jgi:hypothetical protein
MKRGVPSADGRGTYNERILGNSSGPAFALFPISPTVESCGGGGEGGWVREGRDLGEWTLQRVSKGTSFEKLKTRIML